MRNIQKILNRISSSKMESYDLPLLDNKEDAIELSLEISKNIQKLNGDQKFLFLTDLAEINRGFLAREEVLSDGLQNQRSKITRIHENMEACAKYYNSSSLGKAGEG